MILIDVSVLFLRRRPQMLLDVLRYVDFFGEVRQQHGALRVALTAIERPQLVLGQLLYAGLAAVLLIVRAQRHGLLSVFDAAIGLQNVVPVADVPLPISP